MKIFLTATLLGFAVAIAAAAADSSGKLSDTRDTLEEWVKTRQLISKTRSDWQGDKETIEQTTQMIGRELKMLDDQFAKLSTNNTQVEKERLEAAALLQTAQDALAPAQEFSTGLEGKIRALVPRLPGPLQDILKPLLARLPTDAAATKMKATERVQALVGILNELDKFNNGVTIFSENRKNRQGAEISVETVYVGLGAAYFVNDAGDFAGTGVPGTAGWEWSARPELAEHIREVIRIYRNERPAKFVSLPVTIK